MATSSQGGIQSGLLTCLSAIVDVTLVQGPIYMEVKDPR